MRLKVSRSKNSASYYVTKTIYEGRKERTVTVEKLGTEAELKEKYPDRDPYEWAKEYIAELNRLEKEGKEPDVIAKYSPSKLIAKDEQLSFNVGYLFLQKIYYSLGLDKMCKDISKKHKFSFNLDSVLSRLIYSRILFPGSKLSSYELSKYFIEQPDFDLQHVYRSLDVIDCESDFIQSTIYKNSLNISKRSTGVLYYDCTNFFFEIEEEDELRRYGVSKEHRPNPLIQMGLFMDAEGIPLAFTITPGNENEQGSMKPLEEQILSDFDLSKFVVCTDAGLDSSANRKFNDKEDRAFITTQSIKKLKKYIKDWALEPNGWRLTKSRNSYDIREIDEEKHFNSVFYKERWIKENGLEQKLIITYSVKYRNYQRKIRNRQVEKAVNGIERNKGKLEKSGQNDYRRFIKKTNCTIDGEIADKTIFEINEEQVRKEESYDGFYAVCTNLEDEASMIIKVNKRRWQIEECFRIMKSEFKARPVYLSTAQRIRAHFTTCFIALTVYRLLEKKLSEKYTCSEIVDGLSSMNVVKSKGDGYIPAYTRNDFTDYLHELFGFRTDYEILTTKMMKNIFKTTKN